MVVLLLVLVVVVGVAGFELIRLRLVDEIDQAVDVQVIVLYGMDQVADLGLAKGWQGCRGRG